MRLQSAIEYLTTYGWALIIIAIVLAVFYSLNIFNLSAYEQSSCILQSGFSCQSPPFLYANGLMELHLLQTSTSPILVTSLGCTTNSSLSNVVMQAPYNPPTNTVFMPIDSNYTFYVECYGTNNQPLSGSIGSTFSGTIVINYTNNLTGFGHSIYGKFTAKVTK